MIKKLLIPVLCTMILTGCGNETDYADAEIQQQNVTPNIMVCNSNNSYYCYVVDKNTGVVYLKYNGYTYSAVGGITVMLNADGTPVTAQQLGIEY